VIPADAITAWGTNRPWPAPGAIEQDLLLGHAIVEIYRHPLLADELVFRGGTCLHQVHLRAPRRYSEDLDFVRRTHGPIGPVFDALRDVAADMGMAVYARDVTDHPKMKWRGPATHDPNIGLKIKVEINTHETSPAADLIRIPFSVHSPSYFTGSADVLTFTPAELVATKIRALYQRKKGRDLFDLWLALTEMKVPPAEILTCFPPYRPDAPFDSAHAVRNLTEKLADRTFVEDLSLLVASWPADYDIQAAGRLVMDEVLSQV
jgi:predicted nucleotidyltransferase component of viral defense system